MFLSFLSRKEKENFLELAWNVANCDKNFHTEEKKLIEFYRSQMNLHDYDIQKKALDIIIEEFNGSTFISKTSMLLEILSLILADLEYDGEEQKVVNTLRNKWDINDEQFKDIVHWLKEKDIILKIENI